MNALKESLLKYQEWLRVSEKKSARLEETNKKMLTELRMWKLYAIKNGCEYRELHWYDPDGEIMEFDTHSGEDLDNPFLSSPGRHQYEKKIKELRDEVEKLNAIHKQSIDDWCEDDTDTRDTISRVISQKVIDGDSYAVPPTGDLVEMVVVEAARLKTVVMNTGIELDANTLKKRN